MRAFLSLLLGLSLSGTLLALLLMLLRRVAGSRLPSAFYYFGWLLVLLRFVLPLPGLLPGFALSEKAPAASLPAAYVETARDAQRIYNDAFHQNGAGMAEDTPSAAPVTAAGYAAETDGEDTDMTARRLYDLRQVLRAPRFWMSLWSIGAVLSAAWYGGGYLRFRRELTATLLPARPSDRAVCAQITDAPCPRLCRSRAVRTPMLLGVLRPMIVLPDEEYPEPILQGVLAHELTHHRRGDVLFKWFAVLVTVLHWFNPVTRLFRSELDRACELACDERLLRHMDAGEKQLYGDMLLTLAAERRLPRSVVATSFAVEKRNLKERLSQIMTYRPKGRAALCLALAAILLLSGCAAAIGPRAVGSGQTLAAAAIPSPAPAEEEAGAAGTAREVRVDNIDDFLNAIAPDTTIHLQPGVYDLSAAKSYGEETGGWYYAWGETYDGYELVIRDADNLVIAGEPGEDGAEVLLSAVPRYAQVIRFEHCDGLTLSGFTAGHTTEPGQCAGGVLSFDSCRNTRLTACRLYGCGVLGIKAVNCDTLFAEGCAIYDCSTGAVMSTSSRDIRLLDCEIYNCGRKDGRAGSLFEVNTSTGFAVINSAVHDNDAMRLLRSTSAEEVYLLGTEIRDNVFSTYFAYNLISPMVGGCSFSDSFSDVVDYEGRDFVFLPGEGGQISVADLAGMELDRSAYSYDGPAVRQTAAVDGIPVQDGTEYHVTSVDEFLTCIGSDTTIYLDGELFDLSTASNYGGYGGEHYYWVDIFDGPGLVITGVQNLRLIGQGKDETRVEAVPRYADVLRFESCGNVTVAALTAGHTKGEPGSCSGDVLAFSLCRDVHVVDCGLFGCGVFGVRADNCARGEILRTEIYECSMGAACILRTDGFVFTDCSVHDCAGRDWGSSKMSPCNIIQMSDSGDCLYNGITLANGVTLVGDGEEVRPREETAPAAAQIYTAAPTPAPDYISASLHLYFYEAEIKSGGFTMHVGEDPINLTARILADGKVLDPTGFEWSVGDPEAVGIEPVGNGARCMVWPIAPTEKGGTTLTVVDPAARLELTVPVYVIG